MMKNTIASQIKPPSWASKPALSKEVNASVSMTFSSLNSLVARPTRAVTEDRYATAVPQMRLEMPALSLQCRPEGNRTQRMADPFEDGNASDLSKPRENLLLGHDGLEQVKILVEHVVRLVEDDQQQSRFADLLFSFHL